MTKRTINQTSNWNPTPVKMEWKPIETAPKNGESILLCVAGFIPLVGLFNASLGWVDFDEDDKSLRDLWIEEGTIFAPTHWMPLPQPPAGSP